MLVKSIITKMTTFNTDSGYRNQRKDGDSDVCLMILEHFEMVARKLPVIRPKVDGPSELIEGSKWMGQKTQSGRSRSVQYIFTSKKSVKLDGPQMSKCMTQNCQSGRSESVKVEGLKIFRTLSAM